METNTNNPHDYNNMRYVGWEQTSDNTLLFLFSQNTINIISNKITQLLEGTDKDGQSIRVTDRVITNVLSNTYENTKHKIGDIYSRYIVPQDNPECMIENIINKTIETIVNYIITEAEMETCNQSLSKWNSILGGQNEFYYLIVKSNYENTLNTWHLMNY